MHPLALLRAALILPEHGARFPPSEPELWRDALQYADSAVEAAVRPRAPAGLDFARMAPRDGGGGGAGAGATAAHVGPGTYELGGADPALMPPAPAAGAWGLTRLEVISRSLAHLSVAQSVPAARPASLGHALTQSSLTH